MLIRHRRRPAQTGEKGVTASRKAPFGTSRTSFQVHYALHVIASGAHAAIVGRLAHRKAARDGGCFVWEKWRIIYTAAPPVDCRQQRRVQLRQEQKNNNHAIDKHLRNCCIDILKTSSKSRRCLPSIAAYEYPAPPTTASDHRDLVLVRTTAVSVGPFSFPFATRKLPRYPSGSSTPRHRLLEGNVSMPMRLKYNNAARPTTPLSPQAHPLRPTQPSLTQINPPTPSHPPTYNHPPFDPNPPGPAAKLILGPSSNPSEKNKHETELREHGLH